MPLDYYTPPPRSYRSYAVLFLTFAILLSSAALYALRESTRRGSMLPGIRPGTWFEDPASFWRRNRMRTSAFTFAAGAVACGAAAHTIRRLG